MNNILLLCLLSIVYSSVEISSEVVFDKESNTLKVESSISNHNLREKFNEKNFIDAESIVELGLSPFSQLYMIDSEKSYSAEYNIISSYSIDDVFIDLDHNLNNSNLISSELMVMRGVDFIQLTFYPISYNSDSKVLTIIEDFNIHIIEEGSNSNFDTSINVPISREYVKILDDIAVNLDLGNRSTDKMPAILYVCGSNFISNSYFQDLVDWRRKNGFVVYTVTTLETGSSFNDIKSYIDDAYFTWENPPEYVVLVGDTNFISKTTASGGDTDYPYTLIDGNDLLPEIFIGRIPAGDSEDLNNIINKTLAYEKASFIEFTGTDWYETAGLVGDPTSSGNSVIITNEYIENTMTTYGFENPQGCYGCSSYPSWMQNKLSDGLLYFNYRGYIGTSGFGSSNINNANNGYMTPFATFITCSTGDFGSSWGNAIIEDLVRAGTTGNPKGAVAAVGTATSSTHTTPNNIVNMGIYHGIFSNEIKTAGAALVSGKMALHNTYPTNPNSMTYQFTHWNNLMGDPMLHLWTDTPKHLVVSYPGLLNLGTNAIDVMVTDDLGNPVSDAKVVVYLDQYNLGYSYTDEQGRAIVDLGFELSASTSITVAKRNYVPFSDMISISDSQFITVDDEPQVDDSGSENQNGLPDPGEEVDVYFRVANQTLDVIQNLTANVSSDSDKIDIISSDFNISQLSAYPTPTLVGPIRLFIHEDLIASDNSNLILTMEDDVGGNWVFNVRFIVISPELSIENVQYSTFPNPGSTLEIDVTLRNLGDLALEDSYVSISSANSLINFIQSESAIENIESGELGANVNSLVVELSENIIDGAVLNLIFHIHNESGYSQELVDNITVGIADQYDPLGPDEYGYYIYDWLDIGYSLTPFYDWIEINPLQGGDGVDMGISDAGNGNSISNSTKYVDLPFDFTFYGITYNQISVNANGWIAFGDSNMESFRNYQLPGAGGPSPMVAAFWDDLKTTSNSKVLKLATDEYVIIEWLNMKTQQYNSDETFQIILYNSMTPTGDDDIKIQYKEFNNTTNGSYPTYHGCFSTVGIENNLGNIGLEYTFDNSYPASASPLEDESAIFITTRNTTVITTGDVNQDQEVNVQDVVLIISEILNGDDDLLDPVGQFAADADSNETINVLDAIIVINIILDS